MSTSDDSIIHAILKAFDNELCDIAPSAHLSQICRLSSEGLSTEEIVKAAKAGDQHFDLTSVLSTLADLATLTMAAISAYRAIRARGGSVPTSAEVVSSLPAGLNDKPDAGRIAELVVEKSP